MPRLNDLTYAQIERVDKLMRNGWSLDKDLRRRTDQPEQGRTRAAISEGQLNRPDLLALHHEHQNAVRSVLINEIKYNHGLIAEILAAAETGV